MPAKALKDGLNFRIKSGVISSLNLGWSRFSTAWNLNGPVMLINSFMLRSGIEYLMMATTTDVYYYDPAIDRPVYLTPIYATGTVTVAGTAVTGVGTLWLANAKVGDKIAFTTATEHSYAATYYEIANVIDNTHITLTASAGVVGAGHAYTIRQLLLGNRRDLWDWSIFVQDTVSGNDLWFATNGVNTPMTWNGLDATITLHPELGFVCGSVTSFSNMMIYGNVNLTVGGPFQTSIINSDIGMPLHAGSTGTGVSEQFRTHDGTDKIIVMLPLADNLVIYCEKTPVVCSFIGAPLVFSFRVAANGYGPVGPAALADFGDHHEFVNVDAQYGFDGVALREINSHVFRDVIRQSAPDRREFTFGHFDEQQGDLIWSVPSSNDPGTGADRQGNYAWAEHYLEDVPQGAETAFSKRTFPFTTSGYYQRRTGLTWQNAVGDWISFNYSWNDQFFQLAFPLNLMGDENGYIYIISDAQDGNGVALPSFARFGRMAMGSGRERSLLRRVYPFTTALGQTLEVTPYFADHASGSLVSGGTFNFDTTLLEGQNFVSPFRRGRFMSLQFGSSAGDPWVLEGYDIDVTGGGKR